MAPPPVAALADRGEGGPGKPPCQPAEPIPKKLLFIAYKWYIPSTQGRNKK